MFSDARSETRKRMVIVKKITPSIERIVEGILLGGSMGYGKNYSVTKESDIDLAVLIKKNSFDKLLSTEYFKDQISFGVQKLFKKGKIGLIWVTKFIDLIKVNTYVYDCTVHKNFCLLKKDINGFIKGELTGTFKADGFNGEQIVIIYTPDPFEDGFLYRKPALVRNKFWNTAPICDFFYTSAFLYQKDNYLDNLEKEVWKTTIKQLIKEYGPNVDLKKANILNSYFIYKTKPERLPKRIISKIQERTMAELKRWF